MVASWSEIVGPSMDENQLMGQNVSFIYLLKLLWVFSAPFGKLHLFSNEFIRVVAKNIRIDIRGTIAFWIVLICFRHLCGFVIAMFISL